VNARAAPVRARSVMHDNMKPMTDKDQVKRLIRNVTALLEAMRFSCASASGEMANVGQYIGFQSFVNQYNAIAERAIPLLRDQGFVELISLDRQRRTGSYPWPQQKQVFDMTYSRAALLKSTLEGTIGYAEDATHNIKDFIAANLRRAIFQTPGKELEIQNGIESLFIGRGMAKGTDYDRETGRVKTSGKESIPDFILSNLQLCLEVKLSTNSTRLKEIVDEINADIRAYGTQYERQLYVVYDLGTIRDEAEFRRHLEDAPGVSVLIVKH